MRDAQRIVLTVILAVRVAGLLRACVVRVAVQVSMERDSVRRRVLFVTFVPMGPNPIVLMKMS